MFSIRNLGYTICLFSLHLGRLSQAQDLPETLPDVPYHLTARPWKPLGTTRSAYLDDIEGIVRVARQFQNAEGAIIDPYLRREHQYSTPYYAYAVGLLLHEGGADDLKQSGIRAMSKACLDFSHGNDSIPDQHGEFYIAPLAEALDLYAGNTNHQTLAHWEQYLFVPLT